MASRLTLPPLVAVVQKSLVHTCNQSRYPATKLTAQPTVLPGRAPRRVALANAAAAASIAGAAVPPAIAIVTDGWPLWAALFSCASCGYVSWENKGCAL